MVIFTLGGQTASLANRDNTGNPILSPWNWKRDGTRPSFPHTNIDYKPESGNVSRFDSYLNGVQVELYDIVPAENKPVVCKKGCDGKEVCEDPDAPAGEPAPVPLHPPPVCPPGLARPRCPAPPQERTWRRMPPRKACTGSATLACSGIARRTRRPDLKSWRRTLQNASGPPFRPVVPSCAAQQIAQTHGRLEQQLHGSCSEKVPCWPITSSPRGKRTTVVWATSATTRA